jgi:CheY-like chemotaxis protein
MGGNTPLAKEGLIRPRLRRFQELRQNRIRHILLVSSLYDSFLLSEDGLLNEALLRQFADLNLGQNPDVVRVSTGTAALSMALRQKWFDLIITDIQVGEMDALELARRLEEEGLKIPVILMAYNRHRLRNYMSRNDLSSLERVFVWQGDPTIMMAMVNYMEDRLDVHRDTGVLGVPAIILVEDNVRYYSSFLPVIYSQLMEHTHNLIAEGLNLSQKSLRMRARTKILLCSTFEEAWGYIQDFEEDIQGIITDVDFPWAGKRHAHAGIELAKRVRAVRSDIPIVLQSSTPENEQLAHKIGAMFLQKGSPLLLNQLRAILLESFGFGDFVFRDESGAEIGRAADLPALTEKVRTVPGDSIFYHGDRHHFSYWLKARTEFALAAKLRAHTIAEYESPEDLRADLLKVLIDYRSERDRTVVADFDNDSLDSAASIMRIGSGSLGGKVRGLAFINRLLAESYLGEKFPDTQISVPPSVVLGTDYFDQFLNQAGLRQFAIDATNDDDVVARFMALPFPEDAVAHLRTFLERVKFPLAVRSSGLLEDSPDQPFAGIYDTHMLPNNDPSLEMRLVKLVAAVKMVYASTFSCRAKSYLKMTHYRLEEDKMAVIIQQLVGRVHGTRFYPDFSGVARSHNFYPTDPLKAEDGVATIALGMGQMVVDGGQSLRFSPRYPRHLAGFTSVKDVLSNSQREFYALDLDAVVHHKLGEGSELSLYDLSTAEKDDTLAAVGSTYSSDNGVVYDGISRAGARLVTFAPMLKYGAFPLAELLDALLEIGHRGASAPVEIEFAGNVAAGPDAPMEFAILQMKPLTLSTEMEATEIGEVDDSRLVCRSTSVLGNGHIEGLCDIVVVDYHRFERLKSREVAEQIARLNGELLASATPYVLVGVGRWGSSDPFLGIPVTWNQITGAQVIVESGFKDFKVTPSQGTHFFQNLSSYGVAYFTVNSQLGEGLIDWDWLAAQPVLSEVASVRHIRLASPMEITINGRTGEGVILKPVEEA